MDIEKPNMIFTEMKKLFLPHIKDFSKDYPEYSERKDWYNLESFTFIIMHPIGSKWCVLGTIGLSNVLMIFLTINGYKFHIISGLLFSFFTYKLMKYSIFMFKLWRHKKTIYNMYLKETWI